MAQGVVKVTTKVPVLALMELTVKRAAVRSVRGAARTTMSAQLSVEGSTRGVEAPV